MEIRKVLRDQVWSSGIFTTLFISAFGFSLDPVHVSEDDVPPFPGMFQMPNPMRLSPTWPFPAFIAPAASHCRAPQDTLLACHLRLIHRCSHWSRREGFRNLKEV